MRTTRTAQAGLSLRWAHKSEGMFSHVTAHIGQFASVVPGISFKLAGPLPNKLHIESFLDQKHDNSEMV